MDEEALAQHDECLVNVGVHRSSYHGGAFEGNNMRRIVRHCDELGFPVNHSGLVALRRFDNVIQSCFGTQIDGDYKQAIFESDEAFKISGLHCTPKVLC